MLIAIVSTAIGILLFLCLYIINHTVNARFSDLVSRNITLRDENKELAEKLTNFLDITRAEALNSYRKGLQDGIAMNQVKPIAFVEPTPIKTMNQYATEAVEAKEQSEAEKAYNAGLSAILTYNGDLPKGE